MKTKLVVIFLYLSISQIRKSLFVLLIFSFLMQVSCRKDDFLETTGPDNIGQTKALGTTTGTTYYVSPTGNDAAAGTFAAPWATWSRAMTAVYPGDIVYFRGGVYPISAHIYLTSDYTRSGTHGHPISYMAYPGEVPIFDGTTHPSTYGQVFGLYCQDLNYIYLKGLTFRNFTQKANNDQANGVGAISCNQITFDQCKSYGNGGHGFSSYICDTITFTNCDSYNNCDVLQVGYPGGTADGFTSATDGYRAAGCITYYGCRAWYNSDDGFNDVSDEKVVMDHCWAFNNGRLSGDGNGFKPGWMYADVDPVGRRIVNCIAAFNRAIGFHENSFPTSQARMNMEVYNNIAYHNDIWGFCSRIESTSTHTENQNIYRNNIAYANTSAEYSVQDASYWVHDHNSWDLPVTISNADFVSVDSTGLTSARQSDGSLPNLNFLKLTTGSDLINAGTNVGLSYTGSGPDIGWFESSYGSGSPATPVYASSSVANVTPSILEMTYNSTLANIVPAASAFSVMVNSVARTVSSVSTSGTKVLLTLASPVVYSNTVTVAYTKPASNPIQTSLGGQAASITAQSVTNNVAAAVVIPVYTSSSVTNATPAVLEITYNSTLASIVPAASAFSVMVNSATRTVSSISISGTKVMLTLASPVVYGNVVTVAYTKPATNPLQTSSGGQAVSITVQSVTNFVTAAVVIPVYTSSSVANVTPSILEMTYNSTLANIVPASSAFSVMVNSVARTVSSVSISGTKVLLTLTSPVVYGNAVTVAYTKPATNPLQSSTGGQAATITTQSVVNNCTPSTNQPPVISISSPINGSSFRSPATITITANASDINGTISKVEFFNGSIKLGERTTTPYSFVWKNVPRGTYSITAMAIDNLNSKTVSTPVSVTVRRRIY
jgi:uncharacterized repeat protein (TIGR02059 family)